MEIAREKVEEIPWLDVESSNVRRVAFGVFLPEGFTSEADVGNVYVEFLSSADRVYAYDDVPLELWAELKEAADGDVSVGAFVNARLKGEFETTRLDVTDAVPGPPTPPKPEGHRPVG